MTGKRSYILLLLSVGWFPVTLAGGSVPGNNGAGTVHLNINFHTGMVLPHHPTLSYLNREYTKSIEINAWFDNLSGEGRYNSVLGAGYFFSGLGNRDVYGSLHAAYLNVLNPHIPGGLPVQFRVGVGLAWATKKFDIENNYFNRAIGSSLNAYGQVSVTARIPVAGERWIFKPGISFHHLSNGVVRAPNQGLNLLTFVGGLEFGRDHQYRRPARAMRDTIPAGKHRFALIYAPGTKQVDRRLDKQIFTSSLILDYGYRLHPKGSVGMGLNFFYNDTWAYIPYTRVEKDHGLSPFQSAIHISLQVNRGPLAFLLHPGVYIYNQAKDWPYLTNRLGLKYSFANNLTLQFAIKSHWFAIADYVEWGIGYEFNR